jgi:hypothetical protein
MSQRTPHVAQFTGGQKTNGQSINQSKNHSFPIQLTMKIVGFLLVDVLLEMDAESLRHRKRFGTDQALESRLIGRLIDWSVDSRSIARFIVSWSVMSFFHVRDAVLQADLLVTLLTLQMYCGAG